MFQLQTGYYGYIAFKAALDNGIFEYLTTPRPLEEIAELTGQGPDIVERLLDAFICMGLIESGANGYFNSDYANRYCVSSGDSYLGGVFRFCHDTFGEIYSRQGSSLVPASCNEPFDESIFATGVAAGMDFVKAGAVQQNTKFLSAQPFFAQAGSMLDAGCGSGLFSLELLREHNLLELILLDLPPVIQETRKIVRNHENADRISCVEGDVFADEIPGTYDIIFVSDALYGAEDLAQVVKKLRKALNKGGVLVLRHMEIPEEKESGLHCALLRLGGMLINMPGYIFPANKVTAVLEIAGFQQIQNYPFNYLQHSYVTYVAVNP